MPKIQTRYFNELEHSEEAVFQFPAGIPGFEEHTAFVFVEQAHASPLIFMQSLRDPNLCFIALPAVVLEPEYRLELSAEEGVALGLPYAEKPEIVPELIPLALVTVSGEEDPVANLMSPVVLNLKGRRGIQAIQLGSRYSLRHPLAAQALPC